MATENKMGVMPLNRLLISMSVPMMISMLVQALYNIVDSMFVAQLSENALTAVSLAFPAQNLMIAVATGTGVGVNAALSRNLGEKNFERANKIADHALFLAALSYVVFALFGLCFARQFFCLQTDIEEIVDLGTTYLRVCTIASFGLFMEIACERLLQSTGKTIYSMYTQGLGAIINIVLDPILIFGLLGFPAMGVRGAAIATVIGQIGAFLLYVVVYLHRNPGVTIHPRYLKKDWQLIRKIYSVGIPSSMMLMMPSLLVSALNGILAAFSQVYVAVLGIYFKLQTFIYMPANGMIQGMRPIIGYNYGAGQYERVRQTIRYCLLGTAAIMLLGTILSLAVPGGILQLFQADAELLAEGETALRIISLGFLISTVGTVFAGVFEALGRGGESLLISLLRQLVITVPAGYILSRFLGASGIWIAFPVSELAASIAAVILLKRYQNGEFFPLKRD